jgi:hypothetical protein
MGRKMLHSTSGREGFDSITYGYDYTDSPPVDLDPFIKIEFEKINHTDPIKLRLFLLYEKLEEQEKKKLYAKHIDELYTNDVVNLLEKQLQAHDQKKVVGYKTSGG